jgi:aryl-alcohol dehydrogenase-like predicted oxidoreductase
MERRDLGRSGPDVSAIGMGTWRTFDTNEDRRHIVDEALAAGITLFDSSPMYGRAESTLARALEGRRERAQVATKIWTDDAAEGKEQADNAVRLFGRIDVYQVHNLVNWPAQLALIEGLCDRGLVSVIGATHYQESAFGELMKVMRTGRIGMVQIPYNPLRQESASSVLPLAEELGLGVFVMSPLQGGILRVRPRPDDLARLGVRTWPQAVLKWIASDPRVSCVLTATQTRGHAIENAEAGSPPWFTKEQRALVESIARGAE